MTDVTIERETLERAQLPAEISPDGREIWDWAAKLSDIAQRRDDAHKLAIRIRNMETTCGSCSRWMTRSCPGERHDNKKGRSVGPSSMSPKCGQFDMDSLTRRELGPAQEKLAALTATPSGGA